MSTGSKHERGSRASDEESKTAVKVGMFSNPDVAHIRSTCARSCVELFILCQHYAQDHYHQS